MDITVVIVREPGIYIIPVDLLHVFVGSIGITVQDWLDILLHRKLQSHLTIKPVGSALLEGEP